MTKPSRNSPCPCGSGRKAKACCLRRERETVNRDMGWIRMRRTEGELQPELLKHVEHFYGAESMGEAWAEFLLWPDELPNPRTTPEFESVFLPWFLYGWVPENDEREGLPPLPERMVAAHYAERKGAGLGTLEERFITEACAKALSIHMVTSAEPGATLGLHDVLLGGDVTVHERQASQTLRPGMMILARVVQFGDDAFMLGCSPYVIPREYHAAVLGLREKMEAHVGLHGHDLLREYDIEIRDLYLDARLESTDPRPPELRTSTGDPFQWTTLRYDLACTPQEAFDALWDLARGETRETLLSVADHDAAGRLQGIEIPWIPGDGGRIGSGVTLFGTLRIDGDRLVVQVNSETRAERIRGEIGGRFGERVVYVGATVSGPDFSAGNELM